MERIQAIDSLPDAVELSRSDLEPLDEFRTRHHTAVLVIMFTDLKGSTELAEKRGEVFARQLRHEHDKMLRAIIEHGGAGSCIKNIGDALMCIFAEPTAAVERALKIQEKLSAYNAEHADDPPMEVRIGMHMGQVSVEGEATMDVFGRHVNRAARIESLADGGQVLMTEPVYDNARGWLEQKGVEWADHGHYRLKGIADLSRVFEVCPPGTPPRQPSGDRPRERHLAWLLAPVLLIALIALVVWQLRPTSPPLTSRLFVRVMRGDTTFVELEQALPLQTEDRLQLVGEVSRSAYAGIVWVDSEGSAHVVASSDKRRVKSISYPSRDDQWVTLQGPPGTELLILVTSDTPLGSEDELLGTLDLESVGPLPELEQTGAIWIDREGIEEVAARPPAMNDPNVQEMLEQLAGASRRPGAVETRVSEAPSYRADKYRHWLRERLADFHGVAVTHQAP